MYVGLNSADEVEERADLALAELIRIGGFDRSTLVIVTPTGTGWVDPESQMALEYLLRGDVASVSVQYSYLASWLALLADPEYGIDTARAVFQRVYDHWRSLPRDARPKLYVHGLSLGSFNSDMSHDLYQVIGDPYDGAFWAGPPFASRTWNSVTRQRNHGTPFWLPEFRDGSVIRFTSQTNKLDDAPAPWGPYRVIYLQYASDAITFFDPNSVWRKPPWLAAPIGPDVSPDFIWLPVVTFLQLGIDVMTAVQTPFGHGHNYLFEHYLDGWVSLTDAPGWTPEGIDGAEGGVRGAAAGGGVARHCDRGAGAVGSGVGPRSIESIAHGPLPRTETHHARASGRRLARGDDMGRARPAARGRAVGDQGDQRNERGRDERGGAGRRDGRGRARGRAGGAPRLLEGGERCGAVLAHPAQPARPDGRELEPRHLARLPVLRGADAGVFAL